MNDTSLQDRAESMLNKAIMGYQMCKEKDDKLTGAIFYGEVAVLSRLLYICPECNQKKVDDANKEAIDKLGVCLACDSMVDDYYGRTT